MKTAIFSDTHFTKKFDEKRYKYLNKMINKYDQVVINGDFWDGYQVTFDEFLNSEWSRLFPLLKEKNTIYVYGNHDRKEWQDDRNSVFSSQAVQHYIMPLENRAEKLVITHGDLLTDHSGDNIANHKNVLKLFLPYYYLRTTAEEKIGKKYGWKKDKINQKVAAKSDNRKILELVNSDDWGNQILVMSHTHSPYFKPKSKYINTGNINFHLASYLSIHEGDLELKKETF